MLLTTSEYVPDSKKRKEDTSKLRHQKIGKYFTQILLRWEKIKLPLLIRWAVKKFKKCPQILKYKDIIAWFRWCSQVKLRYVSCMYNIFICLFYLGFDLCNILSCSRHRTTKFPNSESPIFFLLAWSNSRARHSAIYIMKSRNLF